MPRLPVFILGLLPLLASAGTFEECAVDLATLAGAPSFTGSQVHLWLGRTDSGTADPSLLSGPERDRADGILQSGKRDEFVASRTLLRKILGRYTGLPAGDVPLAVEPGGKPYVDSPNAVAFNLSHSKGRALLGVASPDLPRGTAVGIDIEKIDPARDWKRLAPRVLSAGERAYLEGLAPAEASREFFRVWAAKEAVLKALGTGINRDLTAVSVLDDRGRVSLSGSWENRHYRLLLRELPEGYQAAVALVSPRPLPDLNLKLFRLP